VDADWGVAVIGIKPGVLKESKPHEYAMRFIFGGVCTVAAGLIAKKFGPGVGGLFLAFPAIFPASASLIESHEKRRKKEAGIDGTRRGRDAAALDAAGAALAAIALVTFAAVVWLLLDGHSAVWVIAAASVVWGAVSVGLWWARRMLFHFWARRHIRATRAQGVLLKP
jgi:hypothetical protein